jgi:hypothetical protein
MVAHSCGVSAITSYTAQKVMGVNLLNGNPIIAGSYRGTLTVTIDPNL